MDIYTAIEDVSVPSLCLSLHVGDVVGRLSGSVGCIVNGVTYSSTAFYNWIGATDSLHYFDFSGVLPDPSTGSSVPSGIVPIISGSDFVVVSAAGWGFIPSGIAVVVLKPNGGDNLFATVRETTITADGFTADLSAPASGSGYSLSYLVTE